MGANGCHKASQNRSKIDKKSMQKSMRNLGKFLHGLGSVFGRLWGCLWDPGHLKMSVLCKRGAHFQNFDFFRDFVTFWNALGLHSGAKGDPKRLQNLIKTLSDFWIALGSGLGRQRAA